MKTKLLVICILSLVILVGCKEKSMTDSKKDGIYYEPVSTKDIGKPYDPLRTTLYSLLLYNGRIYTSVLTYNYDIDDNIHKNITDSKGLYIKDIYINHGVYMSDDRSKLYESDLKGKLYSVSGYNTEFRIIVEYSSKTETDEIINIITVFDSVNDITLNTGKDLFYDLLVNDINQIEIYNLEYEDLSDKYIKTEISTEEKREIFDKVCNAKFTNAIISENEAATKQYSFEDSYGLEIKVRLYSDDSIVLDYDGIKSFYLITSE